MMKKTILACLFFSLKLYSQTLYNYKAVYDLAYKTDSLGEYRNTQSVLLLKDSKESYFQDYKKYKQDSVNSQEMKGTSTFINEIVITNYINNKINISRTFGAANTFYTESVPDRWKIKNTESVVNGVKCREATLQAYGRNWTACYSEDYPFQFGPYFFAGLPGLILSIEDDQKFYQFKLKSLKKETNTVNAINKGKEVSKEKFYEMTYDADFSGVFFNNFRMENADEQEKLRKKYMEAIKRKNTVPIDKSMRYLFNR